MVSNVVVVTNAVIIIAGSIAVIGAAIVTFWTSSGVSSHY